MAKQTPKQFTVRLSESTHRAFKLLSVMEGRSMDKIATKLVEDFIGQAKSEGRLPQELLAKEKSRAPEDPLSEQDKLDKIRQLLLEKKGYEAVAKQLNAEGILTFKHKPGWDRAAVFRAAKKHGLKPKDKPEEAAHTEDSLSESDAEADAEAFERLFAETHESSEEVVEKFLNSCISS